MLGEAGPYFESLWVVSDEVLKSRWRRLISFVSSLLEMTVLNVELKPMKISLARPSLCSRQTTVVSRNCGSHLWVEDLE